ncbi:hypothetical protein HPB50_012772 [Hyalomma asiaticum]|uniref:Uncharacterized protein n=1 Tax=Hyalomma asiaticum TaxID=266040 RepID=A0ACB7RRR4_HYAAI|nr:hypothetical protein HPB50_012772 [Hyalomma asiaticum]
MDPVMALRLSCLLPLLQMVGGIVQQTVVAVSWDAHENSFVAHNDSSAEDIIAVCVFSDSRLDFGWASVYVKTDGRYVDSQQAYAAGYAEGRATSLMIEQHYANMYAHYCDTDPAFCTRLFSFYRANLQSLLENAIQYGDRDPFWHQHDVSQRQTAAIMNRPLCTVNRICQAFLEEGRLCNVPRGHRQRVTDSAKDLLIKQAANDAPFIAAREIKDSLNLSASTSTIRRRQHENGLRSRVAPQKPALSEANRRARRVRSRTRSVGCGGLALCHVHRRVNVLHSLGPASENLENSQRQEHVESSGRCSVSVWGALSKEGLGPLVRLRGKFNAAAYCDLIESVVVPYALNGPFPDGLYLFQQDSSPIHMAKLTTRVLKELVMMLLEWPPQGADMNIVENVWGAMEKALSRRPIAGGSQDALWAAVKKEWKRLRATDFVDRLFNSLPRRMRAVVAAEGGFTKY